MIYHHFYDKKVLIAKLKELGKPAKDVKALMGMMLTFKGEHAAVVHLQKLGLVKVDKYTDVEGEEIHPVHLIHLA